MDKQNGAIEKAAFSRSMRGYSISEVDKYVESLTKKYSELYHEKARLENVVSEYEEKIMSLEHELMKMREVLDEAKKRGDNIVQDAYENADGILLSIKTSCSEILSNFKKKVEEEKNTLNELRKNVDLFKAELFDKYKIHIELIEQLMAKRESAETLSTGEYVEKVISKLKREISAEYGITIETLDSPSKKLNKIEAVQEEAKAIPRIPESGDDSDSYVLVERKISEKSEKRRVRALQEMINEYDRRDANHVDKESIQLALDIDAITNNKEKEKL